MSFARKIRISIASIFSALLFTACGGGSDLTQQGSDLAQESPKQDGSKEQGIPPVAIMADVHFEDVYGDLKNEKFSGIPTANGKNATIRTMYAQLTSTRLFNENYSGDSAQASPAVISASISKFSSSPISTPIPPVSIEPAYSVAEETEESGSYVGELHRVDSFVQ